MPIAYIDSSVLIAIRFHEPGAEALASRLDELDLISSNLLEAEFRAAQAREGIPVSVTLLEGIEWVLPDRPLGPELARVLGAGYVKGADAWHLASALWAARDPSEVAFISRDERQSAVAGKLGFRT